jgi:hypothetical protein
MDTNTILIIVAAALAVSEALSLFPAIKSNGIFQLIYALLKALATGIRQKEGK